MSTFPPFYIIRTIYKNCKKTRRKKRQKEGKKYIERLTGKIIKTIIFTKYLLSSREVSLLHTGYHQSHFVLLLANADYTIHGPHRSPQGNISAPGRAIYVLGGVLAIHSIISDCYTTCGHQGSPLITSRKALCSIRSSAATSCCLPGAQPDTGNSSSGLRHDFFKQ